MPLMGIQLQLNAHSMQSIFLLSPMVSELSPGSLNGEGDMGLLVLALLLELNCRIRDDTDIMLHFTQLWKTCSGQGYTHVCMYALIRE